MNILEISNKPIAVMHIMSSADTGGGERYLHDLIKFSSRAIRHLVVLPYHGRFEKIFKNENYSYGVVNLQQKISISAIRRLVKMIRKNKIDIVHTHGYRANFYGRIAGLLSGKRLVTTAHVSLLDYLETPALLRALYIFLEKYLGFHTQIFICISKTMADDLQRIGIPEKKIRIIPNGVDLKRFHPRPDGRSFKEELGIKPEEAVIGTIGRMVAEKGQLYLIKAIAQLKQEGIPIKCLFLGAGPLLPGLKEKAIDLGVHHLCIFIDPREDIERVYPQLDLFVLPSIREPFGLVLLEAMACGVPVIATACGGPSEFISPGENGELVSPRDSLALAKKITELLSDKRAAEKLAQEGFKTVKSRFDIYRTVREIEKIYCSL